MSEIKELRDRVALLEKIVAGLQLRLSWAGEPHKDQTFGPLSVAEMIKANPPKGKGKTKKNDRRNRPVMHKS